MKRSPEVDHSQFEDSAEKRRNFSIAIFGAGSETKENQLTIDKAKALAAKFIEQGFSINTGGYGGVMKAASESANETASSLGVFPTDRINAYLLSDSPKFSEKEVGIANKVRAKSFPERLGNLVDNSRAYIVLNGGQGTVIELFTALESERLNRLLEDNRSPRPIIIIDESIKMADILSMAAAGEKKVGSEDLTENIFVLNLEPESVEIASRIVENYYHQSIGQEKVNLPESEFKKYNFGEYLKNRENFSEGGGI